jgi:two-component system, chemotaxis family, CheB/CheR fusion protein
MFQSGGTRPTSNTNTLFEWLRERDIFDARGYAMSALRSRALDRMTVHNVASVDDYVSKLESDIDERAELLAQLLGSTSPFGLDAGVWRALANHLAGSAALLSASHRKFRVWSVGCGTGADPYTVAMILAEAFDLEGLDDLVEIVATDIDSTALATATAATYDAASIARLPRATIAKYFDEVDGRYVVTEALSRAVRFMRRDLLSDDPPTGMHLVVCRGLIGAFSGSGRRRATSQLLRALEPDGLLVLGRGEWRKAESERQLETVDTVWESGRQPHEASIHLRRTDGADA